MPDIIHPEPFPKLVWDDYWWSGQVVLPDWSATQLLAQSDRSQNAPGFGEQIIEFNVLTPDEEPSAPTREQAEEYRYLINEATVIQRAVLQEVFARYPVWREQYSYSEEKAKT